MQWRCVGDDDGHLEPELLVRLAVAVQVLGGILQPDPMLLEKTVQLETSLESEKAPHLVRGQLPRSISFEGKTLQRGARQVAPFSGQLPGDVFRKRKRDVHKIDY